MTPRLLAAFSDELEKISGYLMQAHTGDSVGALVTKLAAMATDLRMKGLGGVKRPPEPTEDSKSHAFNMLKNSQKPGSFSNMTPPKFMNPVGPSVGQVATNPFDSH